MVLFLRIDTFFGSFKEPGMHLVHTDITQEKHPNTWKTREKKDSCNAFGIGFYKTLLGDTRLNTEKIIIIRMAILSGVQHEEQGFQKE